MNDAEVKAYRDGCRKERVAESERVGQAGWAAAFWGTMGLVFIGPVGVIPAALIGYWGHRANEKR